MLQLRENLHWCDCEGRAIFLDVDANRYFCLPREANAAFLRLTDGGLWPGDEDRLGAMIAGGLLIEVEGAADFDVPRVQLPERDVESGLGARPLRILQVLAAEMMVSWALRARPFRRILNDIRKPSQEYAADPDDRAIQQIAAATAVAALITRSHDRCLVRALAVHALCRRLKCGATLVFGVTAHPFTAHCWVQCGSDVIVGDYEQARLYTPILVVE